MAGEAEDGNDGRPARRAGWQTAVAMASELARQTSDVLRARTAYFSGDKRPSAVRPEIFASWRRSALLGAQPASARTSQPGLPETGPLVTFARTGVTTPFADGQRSGLDLADSCDVSTRWSCRTGVCHT